MLTLANSEDPAVPIVVFSLMGVFAIVWVIAHNIRKSIESKHREESRREIAAYIAEGSMTPEQGRDLLAAGQPKDCKS